MKKVLKIIFRVLLILILAAALALSGCRLFLILSTKDRIRSVSEAAEEVGRDGPYDAIIVLGASVGADRKPSPVLELRLKKAVELFRAGVAEKIIVTGDHRPGEYDEVDIMWEYLRWNENIPEERLERDYKGFSTYESMARIAGEFAVKRAIVVTQEYHLYRAMFIGKSYGMDIRGAAADSSAGFWTRVSRTVREWGASAKDFLYTALRKELPQ